MKKGQGGKGHVTGKVRSLSFCLPVNKRGPPPKEKVHLGGVGKNYKRVDGKIRDLTTSFKKETKKKRGAQQGGRGRKKRYEKERVKQLVSTGLE